MRRLIAGLTLMLILGTAMCGAQGGMPGHGFKPQSVGLVLSGGGAKGIAHIGVIKALEENNIPIDYITGTSMGAIVGGLYACGFTPDEMMQIIESRAFANWAAGQIDRSLTYYFSQKESTPALVTLNVAGGDTTKQSSILPSSIISPLPMNFGFLEIFSPYTAQCGGDFNRLFVPYRCVTSDVTHKRKVVCSSGSVGDAIRASMNFPIVFHPIERDGAMLYDGGIYENYPIETMKADFAPDIMIGVDVSTGSSKPSANEDIINQLETMIIQHQSYRMPAKEGLSLDIDLQRFALMDFSAAQAIYEVGYRYAIEHMDSIKARVTSRISSDARSLRRDVFKSQTPYLRFDSVTVTGGTPSQNKLLESLFEKKKGADTLSLCEVRDGYYRAITPGKLRNFVPQAVYNDSTGLFNLTLNATVKDKFDVGIGGYVSSSTASMLFFSGRFSTLSFHSLDVALNGWLGQSYMAGNLFSKIILPGRIPSALSMRIVGSRERFYESDRMFFETGVPSFVCSDELFARLFYSTAAGRNGKFSIGVGAGHLLDRYYVDVAANEPSRRDRLSRNLLQAIAVYERSTLNNDQFPTVGSMYKLTAMGVAGRYNLNSPIGSDKMVDRHNRSFVQLEVDARKYFSTSRHFSLGLAGNLLASTRKLQHDYYSTVVDAPAFAPAPSMFAVFDPDLRAYNYAALSATPIWKFSEVVQLRATGGAFLALKSFEKRVDGTVSYGKLLHDPRYFGEMCAVVSFPFASLSAYGRYTSTPAQRWNFGISFGIFMLAPRFLR